MEWDVTSLKKGAGDIVKIDTTPSKESQEEMAKWIVAAHGGIGYLDENGELVIVELT